MKYLTLPETDMAVSQIQLGTAEYGVVADHPGMKALSEADAFRQMDEFLDLGGNFIDTAHVYSDWIPGERARSEKVIGRWVKSRGTRNRVFVNTKGGIDFAGHASLYGPPIDLSKPALDQDIDESLTNLQTDHIDLYWLHRDEPSRPVSEIMETLNDNVKKGKIRYPGCSNWLPGRIAEANDYARAHRLIPFVGNQFEWSLARMFKPETPLDNLPYMDGKMYAFHKKTGMTAFAYSSQAHGFYTKLEKLGKDGISDDLKKFFLNERNLRAFDRIRKLSAETGMTATQISLAFINSQYDFVGIPIIFARTHEQFLDSMSAADCRLTPGQVDFLLKEE